MVTAKKKPTKAPVSKAAPAKTTKPKAGGDKSVFKQLGLFDDDGPPRYQIIQVRFQDLSEDPGNPRGEMSDAHSQAELQGLADNIKAIGLQQPITVRKVALGKWKIVSGHRRARACEIAGMNYVPAIIMHSPEDISEEGEAGRATLAQLVENLCRENLPPMAEARAFRQALDKTGLTQAGLAQTLGISQGQVSNRLRLLDMPEQWQTWLDEGLISPSEVRDLLLPYADIEFFPSRLAEAAQERMDEIADGAAPFIDWTYVVDEALLALHKRLSGTHRGIDYNLEGEIEPDLKKKLDIRRLPNGFYRIFNDAALDEYVDSLPKAKAPEALPKQKANPSESPKSSKPESVDEQSKEGMDLSPPTTATRLAEAQASDERHPPQGDPYPFRLYRWYISDLQAAIIREVKTLVSQEDPSPVFYSLLLGGIASGDHFCEIARDYLRKLVNSKNPDGQSTDDYWSFFQRAADGDAGLTSERLEDHLKDLWREYFDWAASDDTSITPWMVRRYANMLGLDFADDIWAEGEVDFRAFLSLHDEEQLAKLCREWGYVPKAKKQTREQLVEALCIAYRKEPADFSLPECLQKIQACELR